MTYKFQRNTPVHVPVIIFIFISWAIFAIGFGCGKLCQSAKIKKQREREIFAEKDINKIA